MRFKEFLTVFEEPGRVHTIGRAAPRGEPEVSARGLDPRDKDRSVLPKLAKDESTFTVQTTGGHTEWFPPENEEVFNVGGWYLQVEVKNGTGAKFLVTLPLKKEKIELDDGKDFDIHGNEKIVKKYEKDIMKAVLTALGSGMKIAGVYNGIDKNGHFTQGAMPGVAKYRKAKL